MHRFHNFFSNQTTILACYLLLAVVTYLQFVSIGASSYNSFIIFREGFPHLIQHQNLHVEYPTLYYDLFLYHPAFTVFFLPFSYPPVEIGLGLWLVFSAWFIFWAIKKLPITDEQKIFMWWFCFIEVNTSLHNVQTNTTVAGLCLLTFACLERRHWFWAAMCAALLFCIKGYGVIVAAMFLFYPQKQKTIGYFILCLAVLSLLPLPFVGLSRWLEIYQEWYVCLQTDRKINIGLSLMGVLDLIFPNKVNILSIQLFGIMALGITILRFWLGELYQNIKNRVYLLAYLLVWVIVFNHAAESASYIIAIVGVSLWYAFSERTLADRILVVFVFFFSVLAPFDLYPSSWRAHFFVPFRIKAVGCIFVWLTLQFYLLKKQKI